MLIKKHFRKPLSSSVLISDRVNVRNVKWYASYFRVIIYLIFQPFFKYLEIFSGTIDKMFGWNSRVLSEKGITTPTTSSTTFFFKS